MIFKAKPFIKWVGGKTQLLGEIDKQIMSLLSDNKDYTYIEPFVGGGAVLFWILQKYPNIKRAIINDLNHDLINTYKIVKDNPKELIESLSDIQNKYLSLQENDRKSFFLEQRALFNTDSQDSLQRATLFIFLNKTCFNGLYRVNSKGKFNVPFGKYKNPRILDEQTILSDSAVLQKVEILNVDFAETLCYAHRNTLFYCDPPYRPLSETSSFNSYTKEAFNDDEQIRLRDFCNQIDKKGYKYILSNSDPKGKDMDDNFFDKLYEKHHIQRVLATRMINSDADKRGALTELLISNIY